MGLQRASMSPSHGPNVNNESPQHSTHMLLRGEGLPYVDGRSGSPHASHSSPLRSPQSPGSRAQSMYEYRDGRSGFSSTGPTSLPGPGANYMNIGPGSPRNVASIRRDS